jgi:hypothetical protein
MPRPKKVEKVVGTLAGKPVTVEEEKAIVQEIMAAKSVSAEDLEKSKQMNVETDKNEMEVIRKQQNPAGRFILVQVKTGQYRVMNKMKQWISPLSTLNIASKLCSDMNMKDPEQKVRLKGRWTDISPDERV